MTNCLPVGVHVVTAWVATAARRPRLGGYDGDAGGWLLRAPCD